VGNDRGITGVDISSTAVRRVMVEEARWLVNECAFDGIQWDYEICPDGDPDLLSLLQETRAALPPSKTLSVSTPLWAPSLPRRFGHGWSDEYFAKIAANCDQIVVMGYDSGIALPTAYAAFMRDQVTHVVRAASVSGNSECRVLIGVPTYAHGGLSHNARAENITTALRGVRAGYAKLSPGERIFFAGIAPFADYTTQDHEWTIYRRGWLNQPPRTNLSAW
jgi:spore germination protein YaaH